MHLNHLNEKNLNHSISKEEKKSDKSDKSQAEMSDKFQALLTQLKAGAMVQSHWTSIGKHTKIAMTTAIEKLSLPEFKKSVKFLLFQKPLLCRRIVDNTLEDACGRLMPAPFSANQRKTTSRGTCSNVVHAGPNLISTCWIANAGFAHSVYYLRKPRGFSQGTTALQLPPMCSMEM